MSSLANYLKGRKLVSVNRAGVAGYGLQGFIIGASDELVAFEYVYDFQIDGLLILRRSDITEIKRTRTDEFQESLLKKNGIRPGEQDVQTLSIDTWQFAMSQLSGQYSLMTLEQELGPSPELAIGRVLKVAQSHAEIQTFSGTGKWSSKPQRIKYANLTSLQVNNRYARFYESYFADSAA